MFIPCLVNFNIIFITSHHTKHRDTGERQHVNTRIQHDKVNPETGHEGHVHTEKILK